jgi:hypothetical protein
MATTRAGREAASALVESAGRPVPDFDRVAALELIAARRLR